MPRLRSAGGKAGNWIRTFQIGKLSQQHHPHTEELITEKHVKRFRADFRAHTEKTGA